MKTTRALFLPMLLMLGMVALSPLTLSGCEEEGPAEKAGEKVDEAVEDAERAVDDATD